MEYMLTRLEWLVGSDKIQALKDTSIALFGVGGVGFGCGVVFVRHGSNSFSKIQKCVMISP